MPTTTDFDLIQTAFIFNWAANSSCLVRGRAQALADFVYSDLFGTAAAPSPFPDYQLPGIFPALGSRLFAGGWELTWGPGVFIIDHLDPLATKADNTAFVVYSQQANAYVVAMAGTDPAAFLDWLVEDFKVGPKDCVDWDGFAPDTRPTVTDADPGKPQISYGTAYGLWALGSQLVLSSHAPSGPTKLTDYLRGLNPPAGCRIIFTGHSLGGALSPTLANWARSLKNLAHATILALPTAGATPGNATYQTAWDTAFPPTLPGSPVNLGNQVGYFNCDVWNTQDVVPHAWANIYTSTPQPVTTPALQQYYFSEPFATGTPSLESLLGPIEPGTKFRSLAAGRQSVGAAAAMTRSAHTTPFPTIWPLAYIGKDGATTQPQPTGPYTGDDSLLLGTLAHIHVWGYGGCGFGLDLSVFEAIHPSKS